MTLTEFYNLIKAVDADLSAYSGPGTGNYTVYHPYEIGGLRADGRIVEARLKVQVDRYTRLSTDATVDVITAALESSDDIAFRHLVEFEPNTGYIHHIWDCEVV